MTGMQLVTSGGKLPDLVLPDLEGFRHSLLEYTEDNLLIFVWASW